MMPAPAAWALRRPISATMLIWAIVAVLMTVLCWHRYAGPDFRDPDETMRLLQVRDFLAGQSWFDVSQHRINPPAGGPMHWSRLVDVPIAALILILRPFAGPELAERIAIVAEPLLLLGPLFLMLALAVRRIGETRLIVPSAVMLALSLSILLQFLPLRIDHHNWQILMAAVTLWASLDKNPRRGGLIAGASVAMWLHVSSEGLPYAAAFGGLFALRFLIARPEWPRLASFMAVLTGLSILLLLVTHGLAASLISYCDAISPTYVAPMLVATFTLLTGGSLVGRGSAIRRSLTILIAGSAAIVAFMVTGRQCMAGPFETLDPLVYQYWYLKVLEGRPIWEQSPAIAGIILLPALAGLVGTIMAVKQAKTAEIQRQWIIILLLSVMTLAIAALVMRAMSVAHLFALPGNAVLLLHFYPRARALRRVLPRILATVALLILTPLGMASIWTTLFPEPVTAHALTERNSGQCGAREGLQSLAALPRGLVMAPIDIGPSILLFTPHDIFGTGHHRNSAGMEKVIRSFISTPETARTVFQETHATYLVYCPGLRELRIYARSNPRSLAAALARGQLPAWLAPIPGKPGEVLKIYRIK